MCPSLTLARFLGPGFNQFQNWNSRDDDDSSDASSEEATPEPKKPRQHDEDEEGWTEWKNGEDVRHRFNRRKKPGRIIHLGDGSELFTDRVIGPDGTQDHDTSSGEEEEALYEDDSEDDADAKMHVDGLPPGSEAGPKTTTFDKTDTTKAGSRFRSPAPAESSAGRVSPGAK